VALEEHRSKGRDVLAAVAQERERGRLADHLAEVYLGEVEANRPGQVEEPGDDPLALPDLVRAPALTS
jgi:hypothetical protein